MVREGIVLGRLVSERRIKVDRAKIEVIERLPPPVNIKRDPKFSRSLWFLSPIQKRFFIYC
jgi:hypothetical protein